MNDPSLFENVCAAIRVIGPLCQMTTALIAVLVAVFTFRYTKRQNALVLINQNNALANLVNSTIIQSEEARGVLGRLHEPVVGCPDDAVLFMYLNYVHNTFRMQRIGAVGPQLWQDTLSSCAAMLARLRRDQVERLLGRGYERDFQSAVLAAHDALRPTGEVTRLHPRADRAPHLALAV